MKITALLLSLLPLALSVPSVPTFDSSYVVQGILQLPYAEIKENFVGYFDAKNNRSRVDYYGDLVQTIQRGDLVDQNIGVNYKLAYMVDNQGNAERVCFQINGTKDSPVTATTVIPDLSGFSFVGHDICPNQYGVKPNGKSASCEKWESVNTVGEKVNRYDFWLLRDSQGNPIPVYYVMKGYDSLLGSHYDKYEVSYQNYQVGTPSSNVFEFVANLTCRSFPGPGVEHNGIHNPIKEFIHADDSHIHSEFESFKTRFSKQYDNDNHHEERKNNFRHNYRYIQSKNRENTRFQLAVNHFADYSDEDFKLLRGRLFSNTTNNGGQLYVPEVKYSNRALPHQWDWRLYGAVTSVKDQAVCGSCWSFGTIGTIEGVNFVKTGQLVRLSEQQLIDCSWNEANNGCDGGEDFRAYDYIMKVGGVSTDEDYGSYLGADGKCHDKDVSKVVKLSGFYNVTPGDATALKSALYYHGPVTIAIDASHKSLSFYSHGVYYEPQCGNKPEDLDHQVLAVGYGSIGPETYWLVKNSWSTYWGNDGYVLMTQRDNNCGVLTSPTFPIIA